MAGVPLVVSDMGGLPEMAELAGGDVVARGDAVALAQRVRAVWNDAAAARRRASDRRGAVAEHFSREHHLERLESAYAGEIERRRATA
jgi:glycosyltransferase involved in cell wall biosynthesis